MKYGLAIVDFTMGPSKPMLVSPVTKDSEHSEIMLESSYAASPDSAARVVELSVI